MVKLISQERIERLSHSPLSGASAAPDLARENWKKYEIGEKYCSNCRLISQERIESVTFPCKCFSDYFTDLARENWKPIFGQLIAEFLCVADLARENWKGEIWIGPGGQGENWSRKRELKGSLSFLGEKIWENLISQERIERVLSPALYLSNKSWSRKRELKGKT